MAPAIGFGGQLAVFGLGPCRSLITPSNTDSLASSLSVIMSLLCGKFLRKTRVPSPSLSQSRRLNLIRSLSPSRSLARTRGPGIRKSGNADRRGWRCEPVIGLVRKRIRCRTTAAVAASSSHYSSSRSQWRTSTDAR